MAGRKPIDPAQQCRDLMTKVHVALKELEENKWDFSDPEQIELMFRTHYSVHMQSLAITLGIAEKLAKAKD